MLTIYYWSLQHFIQYCHLASHTTYIHCLCYFDAWVMEDLQFKVDLECQIFKKLFMAIFFLSEFLSEICWETVIDEIFFRNSFCWRCMTRGLNHRGMSNKPTHYLLNIGDSSILWYFRYFTQKNTACSRITTADNIIIWFKSTKFRLIKGCNK